MSVLIKGMDMPRDCIECRFFEKSDEYCYARLVYGSEWGKSTGCPLVELPPHGRLIDATKLCELCDIMADKCGDSSVWNQFRTVVEWSPTIIEEERE